MRFNKFNAHKTEVDGILFDSKKEATRYSELKYLEKAGQIHNLELQPKFECIVKEKKICTYRADFRYFDKFQRGVLGQEGTMVVEDVKGFKTPTYRLKKKLVEALFQVKITEL
tara:strand:+ start:4932 stop:5270 length:339 start_codon:yes stop_codon:yes gene_type:complete